MRKYSDEYLSYLKSDKWREQRARAFDHDGHMCAICGATDNLEGHHIRYNLLGTDDDWLEVLTVCHDCHQNLEDIKTEAREARIEAQRLQQYRWVVDRGDRGDPSATIIAALLKRPDCYPYIRHVFSLEDFPEEGEVFREVTSFILSCINQGVKPLLADLLIRAESDEEKNWVRRLDDYVIPDDNGDLAKFLTQTLKTLKQRKVEEMMAASDAEAVMKAVRMQKEIGRLEIYMDC